MSVLFDQTCKDLDVDYSKKDLKVIKSVEKSPSKGKAVSHLFLSTSRVVSNADRLALQESYFINMHSLAPYFVGLCFDRLCTVYVSPLILFLKLVVELFDSCTVSAELPLSMNILHSLLEDFLSHYYYSKAYSGLFKFLGNARQSRNSAVKLSPSVIFKKSLVTLKGLGLELESSEVRFIFCAFCFFSLSKSINLKSFFVQIPSLVQEVFESYLTCYPLSNNIFQSFRQFLF